MPRPLMKDTCQRHNLRDIRRKDRRPNAGRSPHRTLQFEALERRELLSVAPGHYLSGLVASDSRFYVIDDYQSGGAIWAFPVAQLVTASGQQAQAPRDVSCYPGYAYAGHWDKQFIDVADHPSNPLGLPSTLRSWDLSTVAPGDQEDWQLFQIPVVSIGNVYMDNPAYPGANQPRYLDVRLNALEWSPELSDGSRLLFGAGYAGIAGQSTIRGHYLFVVNQHYAKARPVVDLRQLEVESAGDIAFGSDGTLYLSLKGGKLLTVREWHTAKPVVNVRQLTGQWKDFDALLPGEGQTLIGIAQDGSYYRINLRNFSSEYLGRVPLEWEVIALGQNQGQATGSATTLVYGAFFGSRMPESLGVVTSTSGRSSVRPYLFQRWYQLDVGTNGTLRVWITSGAADNPGLGIELYQQVNGGPLIPIGSTPSDGEGTSGPLEVVYTRARADAPGRDYTYYIRLGDFFSPISFRVQVTPGGTWPSTRLGVLGDMLSQEYTEHWLVNAKGWYEILAQSGRIDGGHFAQHYRDNRWAGYEYNWANWWGTAEGVLTNGQLDGIVAQAQAGLLSHVVVMLGSGDYMNEAYAGIYSGTWTSQQIAQFDGRILSALRQSLQRLTATGVPVILSTVVDPGFAPGIQAQYWKPEGRARVSQAVDELNRKLQLLASELGVAVIDSNGLMKALFGSPSTPPGTIWVGGVGLTHGQGEGPEWTFTVNGICPGTVVSGLWSGLVVHALNQFYRLNLPPVTIPEILEAAGLGRNYNPAGPSVNINYSLFVYPPVLPTANNGIAGIAWVDGNRNGRREASESPLAGVTVQLFSAGWDGKVGSEDDYLVAEQVTTNTGQYNFRNLRPGTYYLKISPPNGYSFTYYMAGPDASRDSDIIPIVGFSRPITLEGGILQDNVDIGLCRGSILQATSLGRVDYRAFTNRQPDTGQLYYRFESVRDGLVSVNLDTVTSQAIVILLDANGNPLDYTLGAGQVDAWATAAGQTFYVWVGGLRSQSNLAIGNLVQYDASTKQAIIRGSAQRDQITISVEPVLRVEINQLRYHGMPAQGLETIVVRASGDVVSVRGSGATDRVNITPGRLSAELWPGYGRLNVQVDNWDGKFEVDLGLGWDVVRLGGAPAEVAEIFEFGPGGVRWRGGSFDHRIWGAEEILAVAGNGGNDSAFLTDLRGGAIVEAGPTNPQASRHLVALSGQTAEGYGYRAAVRGFQRVVVDVMGQGDTLNLYDAAEIEDRIFVGPDSATLTNSSGLLVKVSGAERVAAYGGSGGVGDRIQLDGTPAGDRFEVQNGVSRIVWGNDPNRTAEVYNFARVTVNGRGGSDEAILAIADPNLAVDFWASAADRTARLVGPRWRYDLTDFRRVAVGPTDELAATTKVLPQARATLVDSLGHDFLYVFYEEGILKALLDAQLPSEQVFPGDPVGAVQIAVTHFADVTAERRHGGADVALLITDGSEPVRFVGTPDYALLQNGAVRARAFGFPEVFMICEEPQEGVTTTLYGGRADDTLEWADLVWRGFEAGPAVRWHIGGESPITYYVVGSSSIRVLANGLGSGGYDRAIFRGIAGVDERISVLGASAVITYWAKTLGPRGVLITAQGFAEVRTIGNAPAGDSDIALVVDSPGDDRIAATSAAPTRVVFEALDHVFTFEDLAAITAVRFFGGNDSVSVDDLEELAFALELVGDWMLSP